MSAPEVVFRVGVRTPKGLPRIYEFGSSLAPEDVQTEAAAHFMGFCPVLVLVADRSPEFVKEVAWWTLRQSPSTV